MNTCIWCDATLTEEDKLIGFESCAECREDQWTMSDMVDEDEEDFWDHEE